MKKRWLCLFVENEIGVLARISGLFSGKSYNLDSLTVDALLNCAQDAEHAESYLADRLENESVRLAAR